MVLGVLVCVTRVPWVCFGAAFVNGCYGQGVPLFCGLPVFGSMCCKQGLLGSELWPVGGGGGVW